MNSPMVLTFVSPNASRGVNIAALPGNCPGGISTQYRMRGKVGGNYVYWLSVGVDSTGAQYTGGGGTPTEIIAYCRLV
jgi:hypothetical protein